MDTENDALREENERLREEIRRLNDESLRAEDEKRKHLSIPLPAGIRPNHPSVSSDGGFYCRCCKKWVRGQHARFNVEKFLDSSSNNLVAGLLICAFAVPLFWIAAILMLFRGPLKCPDCGNEPGA